MGLGLGFGEMRVRRGWGESLQGIQEEKIVFLVVIHWVSGKWDVDDRSSSSVVTLARGNNGDGWFQGRLFNGANTIENFSPLFECETEGASSDERATDTGADTNECGQNFTLHVNGDGSLGEDGHASQNGKVEDD